MVDWGALKQEISTGLATTERLRLAALQAYVEETGEAVNFADVPAEIQKRAVGLLNMNLLDTVCHVRRVQTIIPGLCFCDGSRLLTLSQFHCPLCSHGESRVPVSMIPLRISPITYQTKDSDVKRAYSRAIDDWARKRNFNLVPRGIKICLFILFVFGPETKDKDLDNMIKPLMDALEGHLFEDDIDVNHLNLVKVRGKGDEDYIKINIRESKVDSVGQVVFPVSHVGWGGMEFIALDTYLNEGKGP